MRRPRPGRARAVAAPARAAGAATWVAAALVAALALGAFAPALGNGFVNLDDGVYITANEGVKAGLSREGIRWAFASGGYASNWHPLTWLSHQADVELFGLDPRGHHLVSLLLHAASGALLFLLLRGLTGRTAASFLAAALFAVHPLRVESVAWASERKDVLAVFFGMLTFGAWLRYLRRPSAGRYLLALLAFALGLLAKPLLVTLPVVLLLLDFWPLGRRGAGTPPGVLLGEKVPFFLLAAGAALVTFFAQQRGEALRGLATHPLGLRAANAVVALVRYPALMIFPRNLAPYYPYPAAGLPAWQVAGAVVLVAAATLFAARRVRREPFLAFGLAWYLVTLLPMAGLVQVGTQSLADRYSYLPSVGLTVAAVWGAALALRRRPRLRPGAAIAAAALLLLLAVLSWRQTARWHDSGALFGSVLAADADNWLAHANYAQWLGAQGREREALEHHRQALRLNPSWAMTSYNLGASLLALGHYPEAEENFRRALALDPRLPQAEYNLGYSLFWQGRAAEAVGHYRAALALDPDLAPARIELERALRFGGAAGARP